MGGPRRCSAKARSPTAAPSRRSCQTPQTQTPQRLWVSRWAGPKRPLDVKTAHGVGKNGVHSGAGGHRRREAVKEREWKGKRGGRERIRCKARSLRPQSAGAPQRTSTQPFPGNNTAARPPTPPRRHLADEGTSKTRRPIPSLPSPPYDPPPPPGSPHRLRTAAAWIRPSPLPQRTARSPRPPDLSLGPWLPSLAAVEASWTRGMPP
jgi:hypothetical protein